MKFLNGSDRILLEVELQPVQGSRFQPTGFPSLGAAEFTSMSENDQNSLLVESSQSMANRLEVVCWDPIESELANSIKGMPVITVHDENGNFLTNSILEAHRMNSPYILEGKDKTLIDKLKKELKIDDTEQAINIQKFAEFVFKYDTNSILHGLFLAKSDIAGGRYKLTRSLSSFIEAKNIKPATSGGVKLDHLDPKGGEQGSAKGFGHIPYSRTEYTAESITAYFSIDLALIHSYNLGEDANDMLLTLALWKIQSFLKSGLRLRTACHLKVKGELTVTEPKKIHVPDISILDQELKKCISKCANKFVKTPLIVKYPTKKK